MCTGREWKGQRTVGKHTELGYRGNRRTPIPHPRPPTRASPRADLARYDGSKIHDMERRIGDVVYSEHGPREKYTCIEEDRCSRGGIGKRGNLKILLIGVSERHVPSGDIYYSNDPKNRVLRCSVRAIAQRLCMLGLWLGAVMRDWANGDIDPIAGYSTFEYRNSSVGAAARPMPPVSVESRPALPSDPTAFPCFSG